VEHDSRRVKPGNVFVAVRGQRSDGLDFVPQALASGAALVVVGPGRAGAARRLAEPRGAGVLEVADERVALALLARNAAGRPDLEMPVIGITGTNGKTTTSYLVSAMLEAAGRPCGLMGTIEYRMGAEAVHGDRTTPEAPEIHGWLRRMRDSGAKACVMEVSSHSLDLRRVEGLRFAAAIFTNLTRDHLDWHGDMETYFAAKRRLFEGLDAGAPAAVNVDDPYGARLAARHPGRVVAYGEAPACDVRLVSREGGLDGLRLRIDAAGSLHEIRTPLAGRPNAYNVLAAAAAVSALGVPWDAIARGALATSKVPGRLERVDAGQSFGVFVDYAHTDDALRNVLEVLRPLTPGRLIVVFGCGGDRDTTKRPLMGAHAARLGDLAWVTSDNPRSEDPMAIIEMVLEGVRRVEGWRERTRVQPDRAAAIREAIGEARRGDAVLIAGKGHEKTQILGSRTIPFDDVEVARHDLEERLGKERADAGGEPS
jgi:UDP-N-acetylmuramoyl-L-alanyl-D-glutamate--2,6-diaminopimelate ligase